MSIKLGASGVGVLVAIVAGAGLVWYLWSKRNLVNPLSDQNAAYQGANTLAQAITGDKYATAGTATYSAVDTVASWFGMSDADKQEQSDLVVCRKLLNERGSVATDRCQYLLEKFGTS